MSELPPRWVRARLAAVADVQLGRQRSPKNHVGPNMRPYLRAANVTWNGLALDDVREMHFSPSEVATFRLASGDILLSEASGSASEVGKPAMWRNEINDCCFQNTLLRVRTRYLESAYLLWFFKWLALSGQFARGSRGVGIHHLGAKALSEWNVPVPPLPEQDRIVAAIEEQFSRLDAGVAALERVRQNLSRMRSAAFALIADSVDARVTLGEIAEVVGGVTKDAKRQSDPSFVEVPYLRVANVQRGYLDLSTVTTIRVPTITAEKLRLEPGDILFNEGGDRDKLGRGWIWEAKIKDCIHQNHVFRARLLTDKFDPRFVSMHGNTFGRAWFEKMGKQTTNLASLNLTTLKSFPVPNLPVGRQREIVAEVERRLSLIDSLQSATDDSLARCNSLRSSILAAAFSGMLVPQDSTDEPASAVLERIAAERAPSNGRNPARTRKPRTPLEKAV